MRTSHRLIFTLTSHLILSTKFLWSQHYSKLLWSLIHVFKPRELKQDVPLSHFHSFNITNINLQSLAHVIGAFRKSTAIDVQYSWRAMTQFPGTNQMLCAQYILHLILIYTAYRYIPQSILWLWSIYDYTIWISQLISNFMVVFSTGSMEERMDVSRWQHNRHMILCFTES